MSILLAALIILPDLIGYAYHAAEREGIEGNMLAAQISAESKWNPKARSAAGAYGLAGIIGKYHPTVNPYDPFDSIDYLASTMRRYLDKYEGSWPYSLAAWNAGEPTVDLYGIPDYEETQRYIRVVTSRAGTRPVEIEP